MMHLQKLVLFTSVMLYLGVPMPAAADEIEIDETAALATTPNPLIVGIPQNNGAFWDGERYWVIYGDGKHLRAMSGPTLSDMTPTPTLPSGDGDVDALENDRTFSVVFGRHGGAWHAWALANRTPVSGNDETFSMYRWRLGEAGLSDGQAVLTDITDKREPSHVSLMPNANDGFEVERLYGTISTRGNNPGATVANRWLSADLQQDTGLEALVTTGMWFPEASWVFEVTDGSGEAAGCFHNSINVGDWDPKPPRYSGFSEWTRPSITSGTWGPEQQLEQPGRGGWGDMNYAVKQSTSHAGQTDFVQLTDGRVFHAYLDNAGGEGGTSGRLVFRERAAGLDGEWTTVRENVLPDDASAWHLALTSDGRRVWLLYVKDRDGQRDGTIYLRGYDPETGDFTPETAIAQIDEGHRFDRMTTQWRFHDGRLVVLYSSTDGEQWTMHAAAVHVPEDQLPLTAEPS